MTKRRMIHSCIWESEDVGALTMMQRLLWVGLITTADDQGRGNAHPGLIRATIFPFDEIELTEIANGIVALAKAGLIIYYCSDEKAFYQIVKWWEYQKPQWAYPSKFPSPDEWIDKLRYREGGKIVTENWSEPLPKPLPKDLPKALDYAHSDSDSDSIKDIMSSFDDAQPPISSNYPEILAAWQELFPKKPQPHANNRTLQSKLKTRMKDTRFKENWRVALERVRNSSFCLEGGWFTLGWFLKNDDNWQKCLDGNYDNVRDNGHKPVTEGWHIPGGSSK